MDQNCNYGYYSMDRLIEFGVGMSMARQMMRLMNESMDNFQIPSAPKPLQQQPVYVQQVNPIKPTSYYLCIDGSTAGPFSESEVAQLIATKRINKETLAWIEGMPQWDKAENIPAILRIVALTPPPISHTGI